MTTGDYGLVSIVMPSYNCGAYIAQAISSVLAQTYRHWELLVVDDGSDDDTAAVLSTFSDPRIRYIRHDVCRGAAVSRNTALRMACGRWVAFLDSDDLWDAAKLERQLSFMVANGYSFSCTCYRETDESGRLSGIVVSSPRRITKRALMLYCWPGCLTVMYDARVMGILQVADIKKRNDWALWLKASRHADCYLLDECLASYRRRTGSIASSNYPTLIAWHYRMYRRAEGMNALLALAMTACNLVFGVLKKTIYEKRK